MESAFDEIVKDYILSFLDNEEEYSLTDYNNGKTFIVNLFSEITGKIINSNENLKMVSKNYLLKNIGLTIEEVHTLENKLTNKLP